MILSAGGVVDVCAINSAIIETNFLNYYQLPTSPTLAWLFICNANMLQAIFLESNSNSIFSILRQSQNNNKQ